VTITAISVGEVMPLWTPQPSPGAAFDDELGMFAVGLPEIEATTVKNFFSPGKLGLMRHRTLIILTLVVEGVIDVSMPYHASLISRMEPPAGAHLKEHRLLKFCLVDAPTGVVRAIRASTVDPRLTNLLQTALCRQVQAPIAPMEFLDDVLDWNHCYPTPRAVRRASTFSRLGT
jgi:hypothetical protein